MTSRNKLCALLRFVITRFLSDVIRYILLPTTFLSNSDFKCCKKVKVKISRCRNIQLIVKELGFVHKCKEPSLILHMKVCKHMLGNLRSRWMCTRSEKVPRVMKTTSLKIKKQKLCGARKECAKQTSVAHLSSLLETRSWRLQQLLL